jgi:hypothetical protein
MTTAQNWLEAALLRSTTNDPGKLADEAELLPLLNRTFQRYYAIWAAANPDAALARASLTLAGAPPTATLPTDLIDLQAVEDTTGATVNVVPAAERARAWHLAPVVYRLGAALVSRGLTGDPAAGATLSALVLDAPAALTVLASVVDARFPVRFHELVILEGAAYLSVKDEMRDPAEYQALKQELRDVRRDFLTLCGVSTTAEQSPHGGGAQSRSAASDPAPAGGA